MSCRDKGKLMEHDSCSRGLFDCEAGDGLWEERRSGRVGEEAEAKGQVKG